MEHIQIRKKETSKSKTKTKQFPNQRLRWTWINELFLWLLLHESKVPFKIFLKHAFFHLIIIQKKKKQKIQNCNKFYYMKLTCRYTAPNGMGLMYVRLFEYTTKSLCLTIDLPAEGSITLMLLTASQAYRKVRLWSILFAFHWKTTTTERTNINCHSTISNNK